jgi:hypothetical protein
VGFRRLGRQQVQVQLDCDPAGDLVLHREQVFGVAVEALGPQIRRGFGVDQLGVDTDARAELADAAFQHVMHAQFAADLLRVGSLALERQGGATGDNEHALDARQVGGQVLGQGVGEILLLGVVRQVHERQDDDRQARRRRRQQAGQTNWRRVDRIGAHRPGDILQLLLAEVAERDVEPSGAVLLHPRRDADAAGLGQPFQPCRDIDAIAEDVAILDDHVALVNTDPPLDPLVFRGIGISLGHLVLDRNRTCDGLNDAQKLAQDAVAGRLENAALMLGDLRVNQFAAQRLDACQRAGLILTHESAVSRDIGREDGGEPALDPIRRSSLHGALPD